MQKVSESMFTPDIPACVGLVRVFPDWHTLYLKEAQTERQNLRFQLKKLWF